MKVTIYDPFFEEVETREMSLEEITELKENNPWLEIKADIDRVLMLDESELPTGLV
jgi:hypothetical protein